MTCFPKIIRTGVSIQPVLHMVDLFEESISYERSWKLPFNSLALCVQENPRDPSWCELTEKNRRHIYEAGKVYFITCDTPMRIRYTTANLHYCIHFRYELFPGVDLFSGIQERYILDEKYFADRIRSVFSEPDPLRRVAKAETAAMEIALKFWPENLPLNLEEMAQFGRLFEYIKTHLTDQCGIPEMASVMGWSEGYFSRKFHEVFHITPKQYLLRELFSRAMGLLNDPQKSIKQIAEELKFSSEFNFSRFIRSYSGYSPSDLRKNRTGPLYVRK